VRDGLGAVIKPHLIYFDESIRRTFADSLNIDNALKEGREQEHRWDYLVGHGPSNKVIAVEPHSAENSEITTLINKRSAARRQLQNHICKEQQVAKWIWVASGKVHLTPLEKATFILAQNGIEFVGRKITNKHLE